jgi:hypothetical protein
MTNSRKDVNQPRKRRPPATTPEARENQLVGYAYDLAEKQLLNGTASSQVITQFLKYGSATAQLEREKLRKENELLKAKTEAIASAKRVEEIYTKAMDAFRSYSGQGKSDGHED